jgi:hypothetical protein
MVFERLAKLHSDSNADLDWLLVHDAMAEIPPPNVSGWWRIGCHVVRIESNGNVFGV